MYFYEKTRILKSEETILKFIFYFKPNTSELSLIKLSPGNLLDKIWALHWLCTSTYAPLFIIRSYSCFQIVIVNFHGGYNEPSNFKCNSLHILALIRTKPNDCSILNAILNMVDAVKCIGHFKTLEVFNKANIICRFKEPLAIAVNICSKCFEYFDECVIFIFNIYHKKSCVKVFSHSE